MPLSFHEANWRINCDLLISYKAIHGNTQVPVGNEPLGRWVKKQRENYKISKLSKSRVDMLNEIEFKWVVNKTKTLAEEYRPPVVSAPTYITAKQESRRKVKAATKAKERMVKEGTANHITVGMLYIAYGGYFDRNVCDLILKFNGTPPKNLRWMVPGTMVFYKRSTSVGVVIHLEPGARGVWNSRISFPYGHEAYQYMPVQADTLVPTTPPISVNKRRRILGSASPAQKDEEKRIAERASRVRRSPDKYGYPTTECDRAKETIAIVNVALANSKKDGEVRTAEHRRAKLQEAASDVVVPDQCCSFVEDQSRMMLLVRTIEEDGGDTRVSDKKPIIQGFI